MSTYISLLRGINVGGHRIIKMIELKSLYDSLGYQQVKTYIQSGNVVFNAEKNNTKTLADNLQKEIFNHWGYDVPVVVITKERWLKLIKDNPFVKKNEVGINKLFVTLLHTIPEEELVTKINLLLSKEKEEFVFENNLIYSHYPNGMGKTKFHNAFLEKKLLISATTRNWKTTLKLAEIAEEISS